MGTLTVLAGENRPLPPTEQDILRAVRHVSGPAVFIGELGAGEALLGAGQTLANLTGCMSVRNGGAATSVVEFVDEFIYSGGGALPGLGDPLKQSLSAKGQPGGYAGLSAVVGDTGRAIDAYTGAPLLVVRGDAINVKSYPYNAVGDGVTNDTAAIQAAITAAGAYRTVLIPDGTWLVNGLNVIADGVVLAGPGATLKAAANNATVVRWSGSYGKLALAAIEGGGFTGVAGLRLSPQDDAQTTTVVNQNYNDVDISEIRSCAEGVVLKTGPQVAGADSGCWYNHIRVRNIKFCTRAFWLRGSSTTPGSNCNRNFFFGLRMGQAGANTGIQIDAGDTNSFFGVSIEGISFGTSPNATPTGVKIVLAGTGGDNNSNRFYSLSCEANTRDLDNANTRTEIYGNNIGFGKRTGANPAVMVGADPSAQPVLLPGFRYPEGSLAGAPSNSQFTVVLGSLLNVIARQGVAGATEIGAIGPSGQAGIKVGDALLYDNGDQDIRTDSLIRSDRGFISSGPVYLGVFTTATRPGAGAVGAGATLYVSDGGAGANFQGSTGAAWVNLG